jgi:hypothetical protein
MGASRWLPALVVIVAAASSWIGTAMAATYSVACDYTAITNAIAGAVPGDIIQIAAGTATLTAAQVITISNSTMGISLIGAGPGQTTLQKVRNWGARGGGWVGGWGFKQDQPRAQAGTDHDMRLNT